MQILRFKLLLNCIQLGKVLLEVQKLVPDFTKLLAFMFAFILYLNLSVILVLVVKEWQIVLEVILVAQVS